MRLHRLTLKGIGPYADRQELDFDELTAQGLFLLTGPTGAGKTTVLDAIVFGLYGTVPGARGGDGKRDKRARERIVSDLRDANTKPEVELEFTVAGRRMLVRRSPDHLRPKARGEGLTVAKASASLEEQVDGMLIPRSTDFYEISDELQTLLGMSADQFSQVVLLPQGEFAGFLRASVADRRAVLEKLFRVDRFQSAEGWFKEQAEVAKSTLADAQGRVAVVVERLVGALGDAVGEIDPPAHGAGPDEVAGWVAGRRTAVDEHAALAEDSGTAAREAAALADAAYGRAVTLAGLESSLAERETGLRQHADRIPGARKWLGEREGPELAADEDRWDQAGREARALAGTIASRVADEARLPALAAAESEALRVADVAEQEAAQADAGRAAAIADLVPARERAGGTARDEEALRALHRERQGLVDRAQAAEARDRLGSELATLVAAGDADRSTLTAAEAALASSPSVEALDARDTELDARRADHARERREAEEMLAQVRRDAASAADGLAARTRLLAERATLDAERIARTTAHQDARSAYLQARENRLDAMASELAATLADGEACPVCGALEHPHPAGSGGPHDLRALEAQAEAAAGRTEHALAEAERALAVCEAALATHDEAQLTVAAAQAQEQGVVTAAALEALAAQERAVATETQELQTAVRGRRAAVAAVDAARGGVAAAEARTTELREALAGASARADGVEVAAVRGQLEPLDAEVRRLAEQVAGAETARRQVTELEATAERLGAASAAGRSTAAAQRQRGAGLRAEAERLLADLTELRGAHPTVRAAAEAAAERARVIEAAAALLLKFRTAQLERDAAAEAVAAAAAADVVGADEPIAVSHRVAERGERRATANAAASDAAAALAEAHRRQRAVGEAETALAKALATLGPAAEAAERLIRLDATVRGGDNLRKISLATYVLAARLEQVTEAATNHLLRMSSGRYELLHHDDRYGGGPAGLGLRVRDGWTGEERDTATLSGGEAFYASLALALGLAEVVTNEAGGRPLDTLLVDEGFGSLDPDTLEEVLGELDQLRAAGRAIGLVSHVAALAERIPAQLQVTPGRSGSTATVVTTA